MISIQTARTDHRAEHSWNGGAVQRSVYHTMLETHKIVCDDNTIVASMRCRQHTRATRNMEVRVPYGAQDARERYTVAAPTCSGGTTDPSDSNTENNGSADAI